MSEPEIHYLNAVSGLVEFVPARQVLTFDPHGHDDAGRPIGKLHLRSRPDVVARNPEEVERQIHALRAHGLMPDYLPLR